MRRAKVRDFEKFTIGALDRLWRFAFLLSGSRCAADELVQEALAKLFVAWDRVTDPLSYARTSIVNDLRSQWRRSQLWQMLPVPHIHEVHHPVGGDLAATVAQRHLLVAALAALPERQRAVVVLRHLEDLSEAQTAQVLHVNLGTVKSQNAKALKRLRELLSTQPDLDDIQDDIPEMLRR